MKTIGASLIALTAAAVVPAVIVIAQYTLGTFTVPGAFDDSFALVRVWNFSAAAFFISAVHVVVLGAPIAALAIWIGRVRWWVATIAGFGVGCLPVAWMSWPLKYPELKTSSSYWDGERMVDT